MDLFGWISAKTKKYLKLKNNRVLTLAILILITGCFFYPAPQETIGFKTADTKSGCGACVQNYSFGVEASAKREIVRNAISRVSICETKSISNNFCLIPRNKSPEITEIEKELYDMVQDYPIREMVPYIAEYDREVAALIIGIAKKESNWGKRAPSKSGEVCYNYWGYRGAGSRGLAMGYGCFASPQEGVEVIGGRIQELADKNINTPSKMIVWKCGSSCRGHNPAGVQKWISDVNIYFKKLTT